MAQPNADPPVAAIDANELASEPAPIQTSVELYRNREKFEASFSSPPRLVDFDDIETPSAGHVAFKADRYRAKGVIITGQDGQYASREFGYPVHYKCVSAPNIYAPGPVAPRNAGKNEGGHETVVTFVDAAGKPAAVAGFGCYFIDCNYPGIGASSIEAFDANGRSLRVEKGFSGGTGSQLFLGVVVKDDAGNPVPAIARVKLVNGSCFPEVWAGEGVVLDDFLFSTPRPAAGATLVARAGPPASRTPTTPATSAPMPAPTPLPTPMPDPMPMPTPTAMPDPTPMPTPTPSPMPTPTVGESAPVADPTGEIVDLIVSGFKPGKVSADTREGIAAMIKGDVTTGRAALARANDAHAESLRLAAGLLDSPIIDPFSLIAYTHNFHEPSAAFVPSGRPDPVSVVVFAIERRAEVQPELRPYMADAVKTMCVINLIHNLRAGRPVGLSDDILFSGLRTRPRKRDPRSSGDQKRYGPLPDPDPLPPKARGAVDHEELCSDPEDRKRYLGRDNAPRYWFLVRTVRNDGYYLCTGLWYNAMNFADKCDPTSRERWEKVFNAVAQAHADRGRYTSGLIVKILTGTNAVPFLLENARRVDPKDARRVTNLVIAFGYFLEATRGKWDAGLKGTLLGELHAKLAEIGKPAELDMARRCGGVTRETFDKAP